MGFWDWITGRGSLVPEVAAARVWDNADRLDQSSNAMTGAISEAWTVWRPRSGVGEIHYTTTQQARLASRLDWNVTVAGQELDHDQAEDTLKTAFGNGLADLVRKMALHLQVAGAYFLIRDRESAEWSVVAWPVAYKVREKLDRADVIVEIMQEDPADPKLTDSPVLAAVPVARELILYRQQSRVAARNRTAQLNTVIYPREGAGPDPDAFERKFTRVMTEPLADEMSAASVVPNVIGFQGDKIAQWRTLDLTGPIDEKLHEKIERLVRQLAVILDIPPEIMTGLGDSSHWNAWEISEDNWLGHVEPMAKLIGQSLALAIARAADLDPNLIEIEPDPAPLLKRRPTIADSLGAYDRGLVSAPWTRRQIGADEDDAPQPGELRLLGNPAVGLPTIVNVPEGTIEALQTEDGAADTGPAPSNNGQATGPASQEPAQPQAAALEGRRARLRLVLGNGLAGQPTSEPEPEAAASQATVPFSTERLAGIDTQAFDSTTDLIEATQQRVMERLGAQLRSAIAHDAEAQELVAGLPNAELPAVLGLDRLPKAATTIAETSDQMLQQGLDRIVVRAYGYTRSAGIKIERDEGAGADAFALMQRGFAELIGIALTGAPTTALAWRLARRVIAVAGGNPDPAPPATVAAPGVPEDEETPLAGIALGLFALDWILKFFGLRPGRYRWQHNSIKDPHPVHEDLDGKIYSGGTVPTISYRAYIGDHAGCVCSAIPQWRRADSADIIGEPPEGVEIR